MWFVVHSDDYGEEHKHMAVNGGMRDAIFSFVVEFVLKVLYTGMYQVGLHYSRMSVHSIR